MIVRYKGARDYEFHIPNIKGVWRKDEWREIDDYEWEFIKNDKDFEIEIKRNKVKEEI
ncbi:MAG: hypothetical protein GYA14_14060 [Ignavibacteria bacterium]|nr:hypothetical protein [Ignavibacteria bacterium]